jgi:thymidylate synthase
MLPFNIASYALLAHIIGKLTNMVPKGIIGDLSNVHIYEPHIKAVKEQLSREPYDYPELYITPLGEATLEQFSDNTVAGITIKGNNNINKVFNSLSIENFELKNYQSHPAIKADMIAPIN